MAAHHPVALLLGVGTNIGRHVAEAFASKGYRIALVARRLKDEDSTHNELHIRGDLSDPESIIRAFSSVKEKFGAPSVVIYNAGAATRNDANNPLSLPLNNFTHDLQVNTTGAFVAAQQAVLAFEGLPENSARTFIYTGNILNTVTMAPLLDLGMGKSATAHMIELASAAYRDRGFKFYYADERKIDGSAAFAVDGEAHGKLYTELAEDASQREWQQTFVKGVGYKSFGARHGSAT